MRTGRVPLTSGKAESAVWGEGNLWKAREGGCKAGKEQVTSGGFDKDFGMLCISSMHPCSQTCLLLIFYTQAAQIRDGILNRAKSDLFHRYRRDTLGGAQLRPDQMEADGAQEAAGPSASSAFQLIC